MKAQTKKLFKRLVSAALAVSMVAAVMIISPARPVLEVSADAISQKYQDQLEALEQQQKELEKKLTNAKNEASNAADEKETLDNLVYTTESKITTANALIVELEKQIADTNTAIAENEALIASTQEKFMERMRMAHEDGNASYIGMVLGAESISDFLSRMERVNAMLEYDKQLKEDFQTVKDELEAKKASLEESVKLQKETLATLEADKAKAEKMAEEAASYYNSLKNDQATYQAELEKIKKAEDELDAQLEAHLKSIANQNSSQVVATTGYMWPLPKGGYISCTYGGSDPLGRPHWAVDCAISYGTPIYAVNDGTVVTANSHYSYGYYIVIDHGNGISSLYAHCSALYVSAGQTVSKGQTIGAVGSTGFSTGNHLHLEFRKNGSRVDPYGFVHP